MTPVHLPLTPEWLYFGMPWALAAVVLLAPLWWLWLSPRRRNVIRFSDLASLRAAGGVAATRVRLVLPLLRTTALVCLIVAAARPQAADRATQTYSEGIAIQLAIDVSSSMTDWDLSPPGQRVSRLEVVKDVARRFVVGGGGLAGRSSDLVGLITFARYADSICPLTLDHRSLGQMIGGLISMQPNSPDDGTAIGDGLALAVERLRDLKRITGSGEQLKISSRVVVLLTDGENNAGLVAPTDAGELAATYGVKVYSILAGTGRSMAFMRAPIDDTDLRRIAEVTGGKFYQATNNAALERIYAEIDKLERTKVEERRFVRWDELAPPWLAVAFAALCLQALLDATLLRKIP